MELASTTLCYISGSDGETIKFEHIAKTFNWFVCSKDCLCIQCKNNIIIMHPLNTLKFPLNMPQQKRHFVVHRLHSNLAILTHILRSRRRRFLYLCLAVRCVCVQDFSDLFREICFICIVLCAKRLRYCFSFCIASVPIQRCKVGGYADTDCMGCATLRGFHNYANFIFFMWFNVRESTK